MITAKVMLLGDTGVGKSSLAKRLVFDRFDADYKTTLGVNVVTHDVEVEDELVRLVLWDTDGEFGQQIFDMVYILGASAACVIADASRPTTVIKMVELATSFSERLPGRPVRAVINKIDLAEPPEEEIAELRLPRADIVLTSAKTGAGVNAAFHSVATILRRRLRS
jgi:small GTP-binding protein